MTQEEKARAYDEVLKTATQWIEDGCSDKEKICLESIFPQLRESEDERMIDWIIAHLATENDDELGNAIAWLEKHKEQKLHLTVSGKEVYKICPRCKSRMIRDDSIVYTSMPPQYGYKCPKCGEMEFDTVKYDNPEMEEQKPRINIDQLKSLMLQYLQEAANEEDDSDIEADTDKWARKILGYDFEQKSAEWSEEDKEMYARVVRRYTDYEGVIMRTKEESVATKMLDAMAQEEIWLKSLRPQPKQEWSEEDEKKYQCIRCILLTDADKKIGSWKYSEILEWYEKRGIGRYTYSRPSWKPSEAQLMALHSVIDDESDTIGNEQLKLLYEHLKKL